MDSCTNETFKTRDPRAGKSILSRGAFREIFSPPSKSNGDISRGTRVVQWGGGARARGFPHKCGIPHHTDIQILLHTPIRYEARCSLVAQPPNSIDCLHRGHCMARTCTTQYLKKIAVLVDACHILTHMTRHIIGQHRSFGDLLDRLFTQAANKAVR
jgi:hypothetical protein